MNQLTRLAAVPMALLLSLALGLPAAAGEHGTLERYARDTWRSFVLMVEPRTGLPADNIGGSLRPATRSGYTSPTNIGMYLWATVAARDLGFISTGEATERIAKTLTTVEGLEPRLRPLMALEEFGAGRIGE